MFHKLLEHNGLKLRMYRVNWNLKNCLKNSGIY